METFLRKIGLIDNLTTELKIQKTDFLNVFTNHVDDGDIGFLSGAFDAFSSSKNEYRGRITFDGFEIKRKRRFFDRSEVMQRQKGIFFKKEIL